MGNYFTSCLWKSSLLLHCKMFTHFSKFQSSNFYVEKLFLLFFKAIADTGSRNTTWILCPGSYKVYLYVSGIPASLGWCWNAGDAVAFVSHRGPLYIWTISGPDSGVTLHREAHSFLSDINLFRWHPKKKGKVVFGHTDGSLSIFQSGKNSYDKIFSFIYVSLVSPYVFFTF